MRPPGRAVRRAARRHRRPLAALCAAAAVWAAAGVVAPPAPATATLTVAARDLTAGVRLGPEDLATVPVPVAARPDGATQPAAGSVLAAPMRRGEPFTDVRLVGAGAPLRPPGSVVVTVRTADPAAVLAVRPGDLIDVLAGPVTDGLGAARVDDATVARGLVVLDVPGGRPGRGSVLDGNGSADGTDGAEDATETGSLLGGAGSAAPAPPDTAGVLVVAADRSAAARLAAATGRSLTVAVVSS